jgi:hypothetical protein
MASTRGLSAAWASSRQIRLTWSPGFPHLARGADRLAGPATDTEPVITCEASPWWRRYVAFGQTVALGGAVVMLSIAIAVHGNASIPLVIIGGVWAGIGVASWLQMRRVASRVVVSEGRLSFVGPRVDRQLRAEDLAEFRWARGDISRLGAAFFVTVSGERIRVPARMTRTFELLMSVKQSNDSFRLPNI